ncbi:MAG: hypothetical protein DRM99_05255, partial [Thermoplasmata archaeon]
IKTISEIIEETVLYYKKKDEPEASHTLVYDSSSETLEPIYFFILDLMNDLGLETEKLVDNFTSSPGSGHFAELGQRATIMQQQATKILGDVNTVLRSVLNIIYDLKEFRTRLQHYDDLKSKDKGKSEAARLALKQIWMDKVDITKGNSSIKAMAMQGGFQTLIDAFLAVKDEKEADKLDLNDRVKRIVKPRILEFNTWVEQSEAELRKRYELEKTYLKSQVNSLKLYSRWAKPYLKAAQELERKEVGKEPALVKTFNTILLELTLFGKSKIDVEKSIDAGDLPPELGKIAKTLKRNYYSCILVDFTFRGIPQRVAQQPHYVFGGKTEITFKAYALNDDELEKVQEEIKKSDIEDILKLIEGTTTESLEKLQEEINFFLEEKEEDKEKPKQSKDTSNPFLAIIGAYEKKEKKQSPENKKQKEIKPDNFIEKTHIRPLAAKKATDTAFNLFDIYKKAHGMPSYT